MVKRFLLILCFCYLSQAPAAEPITQLTLHDAVFLALRYNITIQSSELDRIVQKFDLALAKHGFEPQYSLTGETNYIDSKTNGTKSITESYTLTPKASLKTAYGTELSTTLNNQYDGSTYSQGASLNITQPLLRGFGSTIAQFDLYNAEDQERLNRLNLKRVITEQIKDVITKYRQLLLDYNDLRITKLSLQERINELKRTEIEVKAGRRAGLDVLQSQANIPQQQLSVSQTQNQLAQDKNKLLQAIGLHSDFQFTIPQSIDIQIVKPPSHKICMQTALSNNVDYQIALINLKLAERTLIKARDEARWKLNLQANVSTGAAAAGSSASLFDSANNSKSVGLNLEVPLDKLATDRNIAEKKIGVQKAQIALAQQQRAIELSITDLLNNLTAQAQQIQLAITSRNINAKVLDAEQKKLKYGRSSTFQINILQRELLESELQIISNQINYLNTLVELQSILGTLLDEWQIQIRY